MLSSVDFPDPDGPSRTTNSRGKEVEVDAAERLHGDLAHLIDLRQRARGEDRGIRCLRRRERVPQFSRHNQPAFRRSVVGSAESDAGAGSATRKPDNTLESHVTCHAPATVL